MKKFLIISSILLLSMNSFAMDVDLWNIPQPAKTKMVWTDKAIEVNNINVHANYFFSDLKAQGLLSYYQKELKSRGWEMIDYFEDQGLMSFTKDSRFMYVAVTPMGDQNSIYLVSSPKDLRLCRTLVDHFFKPEISPDADGKDLPDVPRYPNSRRRLDIMTQEEGQFAFYETDAVPSEVGKFYKTELARYGWELMRPFDPAFLMKFTEARQTLKDLAILCFEKGNDVLLITAYPTPREVSKSRTLISITKNLSDELYPGGK